MSVPALRIIIIMAVDPSSIRMKPKELTETFMMIWKKTPLVSVYTNIFHATSQLRRLLAVLNLYEGAEKKHFVSLKLECKSGIRTRDLWLSKQAALTGAPGLPPESAFNSSDLKTAWFPSNDKHDNGR